MPTSGALLFRANSSLGTIAPAPMPDLVSSSALPLVAYFCTPLSSPVASYATMPSTTSTNNTSTNTSTNTTRAFILRTVTSAHTFDVLLYESTNVIEVRLTSISPTTSPVLIGVMGGPWRFADTNSTANGNDNGNGNTTTADYTTAINALPIDVSLLSRFNSTIVRFAPTSSNPVALATARGYTVARSPTPLSYASSALPTTTTTAAASLVFLTPSTSHSTVIPLGFAFIFCSQPYRFVSLTPNGLLQFAATARAAAALESASVAVSAIPSWGAGTAASLAPFFAGLLTPLSPSSSHQRSYSRTGTYPDRTLVIRLTQVPLATQSTIAAASLPLAWSATLTLTLFERDSAIRVDYYNVDASNTTRIAAGLQCYPYVLPTWDYGVSTYIAESPAAVVPNAPSYVTLRSVTYMPNTAVDVPPYSDLTSDAFWLNAQSGSYTTSTLDLGSDAYASVAAANAIAALFSDPQDLTLAADGTPTLVPIGFDMPVFVDRYSHVYVSVLGYMRFAQSTALASVTTALSAGGSGLHLPLALDTNPSGATGGDDDGTVLSILAFAAGAWTTTSNTFAQVRRGRSALQGSASSSSSSSSRLFVLRLAELGAQSDPTKRLTVEVTFVESDSSIVIAFLRVDAVDMPITIGAQGPAYNSRPSLAGHVSVPTTNYVVQVNASSLRTHAALVNGSAVLLTARYVPVPRPTFSASPRSYVLTTASTSSLSSVNVAPIVLPATSPNWTIVAQGMQPAASAAVAWSVPLNFTFYAFGQAFTNVLVQLNGGVLYFGQYTPLALPFVPLTPPLASFPMLRSQMSSVPPFVAFLGSPATMTSGSIVAYNTTGVASNRRFVLRVEKVALTSNSSATSASASASLVTVNVMLYENDGRIVVMIESVVALDATSALTIGVHRAVGDALGGDQNSGRPPRFDVVPDWTSLADSRVAASSANGVVAVFSWQADTVSLSGSAQTALNLGVAEASSLSTVASLTSVVGASGSVSFALLLTGASRESLLMAYGASYGVRLRQALAQAMSVPVSVVQLIGVQFVDHVSLAPLGGAGATSAMKTATLLSSTQTVSIVLLANSADGVVSAVTPRAAVDRLQAALDSGDLVSKGSNVFNAYGAGSTNRLAVLPVSIANVSTSNAAGSQQQQGQACAVGMQVVRGQCIPATAAAAVAAIAASGASPLWSSRVTSSALSSSASWTIFGAVVGACAAIAIAVILAMLLIPKQVWSRACAYVKHPRKRAGGGGGSEAATKVNQAS